ncbi:HAMP domain-containing sensor histidine kinase [Clostridium lundense]|uniref:HAMP domain-containing sensor histidine kinase n=1 Tax=Clostridium lundense TaxID=319475 RepID=UPI0004875645|nr:HAMP domain-containing sensor histidine kinase [Clostridium lundense]
MIKYSNHLNVNQINEDLDQIQSFLDIKYLVIGPEQQLIYPEEKINEEYNSIKNALISSISEKQWFKSEKIKSSDFYFNALGKKYQARVFPLKLSNSVNYLIIYCDLIKTSKFIETVNILLLIILIITAVIAILISNNVSKKISSPISQLINYAKKIGNRQYDAEFIQCDSKDEVGELSHTMHLMVQKLVTYDNTVKSFIQNASHELRTPLMSIQGYAEGIKYGVVDSEAIAIDIIIEETNRLSKLVEDLLYLSKIESIKEHLNFEELDIQYVIQNSIEKVSGIALKNKKAINFLPIKNSIVIKGDQEKLTRAIINILGNCLRYCKKNIDIILKNEDSKIIIIIEDDGCGFDEESICNIFDRFYKGKNGNFGLGLTISKSIIEKHGGNIVAQNITNGGAQFKISFVL